MKPVLILGATSDIAKALAVKLADQGYPLWLAARQPLKIKDFAADLSTRHNLKVEPVALQNVKAVHLNKLAARFHSGLSGIISVLGKELNQVQAEKNQNLRTETWHSNFILPAEIIETLLPLVEPTGFIVGISSVAGDRGRKANYFYGSARAGFSAYLGGLRHRCNNRPYVLCVKPGYILTSATRGRNLPPALTSTPARVAKDILQQLRKRKKAILYTPWYWRYIMAVVRWLPDFIFRRLNI